MRDSELIGWRNSIWVSAKSLRIFLANGPDTVFLLKRQDNHDAVVMSLRCGCSRLWLDKKDKSYVCLSVDCRWMIGLPSFYVGIKTGVIY